MLASAHVSLEPGTDFGGYRIVAALGRGGMASVYRAHDAALERDVALKVLPPEFLHDPSFAERFRQEARVAARLEHPQIVPVHAFGIEQGRPWMALRLITGGSLADRLRRGPLTPAEAASVLAEIAAALDYAHGRGVVHRDVKPANILLDDTGRAYLADFGIARLVEGSSVATATGLVQGTPSYMAPEQAMGSKVDRLADVYALGVVAFECLTGRVPYTGDTPVAILMKHVSGPVPEPMPGEVPDGLTPVLRRCLAKAPAARWPTAGGFAQELQRATRALSGAASALPPVADLELSDPEDRGLSAERGSAAGAPTRRSAPRRRWTLLGAAAVLAAVTLAAFGILSWLWPRSAAVAVSPGASPAADRGPLTTEPPPPKAGTIDRKPASATPAPSPTAAVALFPSPAPAPTADPHEPAAHSGGAARARRPRVYCEARLEPARFRNSNAKDVSDSVKDLREAISRQRTLALAESRAGADAVVQVLERGREPARVGMRKVRVRIRVGAESAEFLGQDSFASFNTWSGAANGAARDIEAWLASRQAVQRR